MQIVGFEWKKIGAGWRVKKKKIYIYISGTFENDARQIS